MEHAVDAWQMRKRARRIQVADNRRHAEGAQVGDAFRTADHADKFGLAGITPHQPLGDIAKPHNQDFFHAAVTLSAQG
ncbi:MAG TPA: hypothetical protein VFO43_00935 [Thiobacillus sp.]|nr:hypothetical protein [Thiobacillus sp.]